MLSNLQELRDQVDEAMTDIDYEIQTFSHSTHQRDLLDRARFRIKQAWHLLDEASEL